MEGIIADESLGRRCTPFDESVHRVLLNGANLHIGGGVQVAASLITEFALLADRRYEFEAVVSPEVADNLGPEVANCFPLEVESRHGGRRFRRGRRRFDLEFTIFGPSIPASVSRLQACGYASVSGLVSPLHGVIPRLKFAAKMRLLRHMALVVVETEPFAEVLSTRGNLSSARIAIVPNCVNGIISDQSRWEEPPRLPRRIPGRHLLFYPARPYPHKNHEMLGRLARLLRDEGVDVQFLLTVTDEEFGRLDELTQEYSMALGVLKVSQLGPLYDSCDAVFFPSSAEVFSAVPLEAMHMSRPFIASRLPEIESVCGAAATYFDVGDLRSAVSAVKTVLLDTSGARQEKVERGWYISRQLPSARARASRYLDLFSTLLRPSESGRA